MLDKKAFEILGEIASYVSSKIFLNFICICWWVNEIFFR